MMKDPGAAVASNMRPCKEDIYSWFRNSPSSQRLDLMCNLLHISLPFELRFIGACVEDLARKHYAQLQEYELKANDVNFYAALLGVNSSAQHVAIDRTILYTLTVYVSVLHSDNARCANNVFKILGHMWEQLKDKLEASAAGYHSYATDSLLTDDFVLLLTMATLHPAFEFSQRVELFALLEQVRDVIEECRLTTKSEVQSEQQSPAHHGPTESNMLSNNFLIQQPEDDLRRDDKKETPSTPDVFIIRMELIIKRGGGDRQTVHLRVIWSDESIEDVSVKYQHLAVFHQQAEYIFSEICANNEHPSSKTSVNLPSLPSGGAEILMQHNMPTSDLLIKYFRELSAMPAWFIHNSRFTLAVRSLLSTSSMSNFSRISTETSKSAATTTIQTAEHPHSLSLKPNDRPGRAIVGSQSSTGAAVLERSAGRLGTVVAQNDLGETRILSPLTSRSSPILTVDRQRPSFSPPCSASPSQPPLNDKAANSSPLHHSLNEKRVTSPSHPSLNDRMINASLTSHPPLNERVLNSSSAHNCSSNNISRMSSQSQEEVDEMTVENAESIPFPPSSTISPVSLTNTISSPSRKNKSKSGTRLKILNNSNPMDSEHLPLKSSSPQTSSQTSGPTSSQASVQTSGSVSRRGTGAHVVHTGTGGSRTMSPASLDSSCSDCYTPPGSPSTGGPSLHRRVGKSGQQRHPPKDEKTAVAGDTTAVPAAACNSSRHSAAADPEIDLHQHNHIQHQHSDPANSWLHDSSLSDVMRYIRDTPTATSELDSFDSAPTYNSTSSKDSYGKSQLDIYASNSEAIPSPDLTVAATVPDSIVHSAQAMYTTQSTQICNGDQTQTSASMSQNDSRYWMPVADQTHAYFIQSQQGASVTAVDNDPAKISNLDYSQRPRQLIAPEDYDLRSGGGGGGGGAGGYGAHPGGQLVDSSTGVAQRGYLMPSDSVLVQPRMIGPPPSSLLQAAPLLPSFIPSQTQYMAGSVGVSAIDMTVVSTNVVSANVGAPTDGIYTSPTVLYTGAMPYMFPPPALPVGYRNDFLPGGDTDKQLPIATGVMQFPPNFAPFNEWTFDPSNLFTQRYYATVPSLPYFTASFRQPPPQGGMQNNTSLPHPQGQIMPQGPPPPPPLNTQLPPPTISHLISQLPPPTVHSHLPAQQSSSTGQLLPPHIPPLLPQSIGQASPEDDDDSLPPPVPTLPPPQSVAPPPPQAPLMFCNQCCQSIPSTHAGVMYASAAWMLSPCARYQVSMPGNIVGGSPGMTGLPQSYMVGPQPMYRQMASSQGPPPPSQFNVPNGVPPLQRYTMGGGEYTACNHRSGTRGGGYFSNRPPPPPVVMTCSNCGASGHRYLDCKEPLPESLQGQFHLSVAVSKPETE